MRDRLSKSRELLSNSGSLLITIDDIEHAKLKLLLDEIYGESNFIANIVWQKVHTRKNSAKYFSVSHDNVRIYAKNKPLWDRTLLPRDDTSAYKNPDNDKKGPWKPDPVYANNPYDVDYKITKPNGVILSRPKGQYWRCSEDTIKEKIEKNEIIWGEGDSYPMIKRYLSEVQDGLVPITIFDRIFAGDNSYANSELNQLFGEGRKMKYLKPTLLVKRILQICTKPNKNEFVIDFFAGSGTTGHAVIHQNEDGGNRKYILVEIGDHFDTLISPRIKKVMFSKEWKDGIPQSREGHSHIFKYQYLEQYEDSLENIEFKQTDLLKSFIDRDTLFRYELDKGTEESKTFLGADVENNFLDFYISALDDDLQPIQKKVDLIESFNYIIGLWVEKYIIKEDDGRRYIAVKGKVNKERAFVVWRQPRDIDPEKDKKFIETHIIQGEKYSKLYVNSDCAVPRYLHIFDEWRKRMW